MKKRSLKNQFDSIDALVVVKAPNDNTDNAYFFIIWRTCHLLKLANYMVANMSVFESVFLRLNPMWIPDNFTILTKMGVILGEKGLWTYDGHGCNNQFRMYLHVFGLF